MPVKVCILTTVHQPFDARVFYKEAQTLVKLGYEVVLIAQNRKDEEVEGVKILALPKARNRFSRIFTLNWKALKIALHQNCQVVHFHDPEFILMGIILIVCQKKVIYDVHEDVPRHIMIKEWLGHFWLRKGTAIVMDGFEKCGAFFFSQIIAVTEDIARRFPKNKTVVIRNLPILELIDQVIPFQRQNEKPMVIYAGGLSWARGIREMIQAMEYLDGRAELYLLGNWQSEIYQKECESEKGWQYTRYLGFRSLLEVYSIMKSADIGISVLYPEKNYLTSLPIKTYEYMACSLPVIMSDFPYWKEIFKSAASYVDPYHPESIAKQIQFLLEHKNRAEEIGKKGREMVENQCNWETESEKLVQLYQKLFKKQE